MPIIDANFWASKGALSAADYVTKNGLPPDPYLFFGVSKGVCCFGNVSVETPGGDGRVGYIVPPFVKWDVDAATLGLITPNPDKWYVDNGVPMHRAALAWPRVTGAPLRDWNNAMTMADGRGLPDEYKWVDPGNPSADPQIKAWHLQYGSVFPTLAEYAAAVESVKASGGPVTQATVTTAYEEIIAERPAPTVSGEIRPDSSLPTQGTDAVVTTVPAPTSATPQIYPAPGGGSVGTIPPLISVAPNTPVAVAVPPVSATPTAVVDAGFLTGSMKSILIAAGVVILAVLLITRRR